MRAIPDPPLMLVTDRKQARHPLSFIIEEACRAGCRWISIREKDLGFAELEALYYELLPITQKWNALLSVHTSAVVARKLDVQALHLAAHEDGYAARKLMGANCLIGQSCHTAEECSALDTRYLDYGMLGPLFPTNSKPGYEAQFFWNDIHTLTNKTVLPLIGIGGIQAETVYEVKKTGLYGIAVMGKAMRTHNLQRFISRCAYAIKI